MFCDVKAIWPRVGALLIIFVAVLMIHSLPVGALYRIPLVFCELRPVPHTHRSSALARWPDSAARLRAGTAQVELLPPADCTHLVEHGPPVRLCMEN